MNELFWLRMGDEDGYHEFDDLDEVANYLVEFYSIPALERHPGGGFDSDGYDGHNYISLFLGNKDGNVLIRELTDEEVRELNESLGMYVDSQPT